MVRPRVFLQLRQGYRVLNFCHHKPKLSLSLSRSLHVSLGGSNFKLRDCNLRPWKVCKSTRTSFRYFSILPYLKPNHFICMIFSHLLFSIHHLNMFAEMPERTGFRMVLSSFARIFLTSRAFYVLYYFWLSAHFD